MEGNPSVTGGVMEERICMVTGANSGIGKETAAALARMGATVVMVCRSRERGQAALNEIAAGAGNGGVELMTADLASPGSVRELVRAYCERHDRLHVLINNAGVINGRQERTEEGIDRTMAVNHLGPFLLTHLLRDVIVASAPARIINVSSEAHRRRVRPDDLLLEKDIRQRSYWAVSYATSKLANLLFTYELARRLEGSGVAVNALHPGWARSSMGRSKDSWPARFFCALSNLWAKCCIDAAATSVYLASSPEGGRVTGRYFIDSREARSSRRSYDRDLQKRLWEGSERLLHLAA
jgi:NAD(P)-dependent dehydrogenase (short-subunit alcohol dehydrogenase family)